MAQALYAKNNALCVQNGRLVVGTATTEPGCVCGGQAVVDPCCPTVGPGYLPPKTGAATWGTLRLQQSIVFDSLDSRFNGAQVTTRHATMNFDAPVQFVPGPGGCPQATTSVPMTVHDRQVLNGQVQYDTTVVNQIAVSFRFFMSGPVGARVQRLIYTGYPFGRSGGSAEWWKNQSSSIVDFESQPVLPVTTWSITALGPSASLDYHVDRFIPNTPEDGFQTIKSDFYVTVSGLLPCALPASASPTGCQNCPDNNTGSALL